jgi:osmotically-inducible protein OsmY
MLLLFADCARARVDLSLLAMKRIVFSFLVGAAAGAVGHWYLQQDAGKRAVAEARETMAAGTEKAKLAMKQGTEDLKEELNRTGRVIREKVTGTTPLATNAGAANAVTATVQSQLQAEPSLVNSKIHVEIANGVATLTGTVSSHEEIGTAMKLALDADGVQRVVSLLQVSAGR